MEDRVREALLRQAERTPPAGPVLAALHRPRRDRKPLLLALATATAAVAAIVATAVVSRPVATPPAGSTAPTAVSTAVTTTSGPPLPEVALTHSPGWVPEGYYEFERSYEAGGLFRRWAPRAGGIEVLTFRVAPATPQSPEAVVLANAAPQDRTTVNGRPAVFTGDSSGLLWQPDASWYVSLSWQGVVDFRASATRVAESVRPDATKVRAPLSLDGSGYFTFTTAGGAWSAQVTTTRGGAGYTLALTTGDGGSGTPTTVRARGRDAVHRETEWGYLAVPLAPDRYLVVTGHNRRASVEELVEVADAALVDPHPDLSWLGR
ncbi:hypothetical protein [Saccharothrix coeruleofusca]|uniref:Uncharacterized protein n=1 Tax=Saccharothrix coeruleofusca TaxID=33919 RepID=A0A918EG64_9PSEU|nr:hypothetical protein [Saccharothrix coeruleofusca]GGP69499.1 hypothetical protein GCM10010185_47950 [Saccharothrix coeruleofusca]